MFSPDMPFEIVLSRKAIFSAAESKFAVANGAVDTLAAVLTLMADQIFIE